MAKSGKRQHNTSFGWRQLYYIWTSCMYNQKYIHGTAYYRAVSIRNKP